MAKSKATAQEASAQAPTPVQQPVITTESRVVALENWQRSVEEDLRKTIKLVIGKDPL